MDANVRADALNWLAEWDANKPVHSIEMGGLGPGYEQCIHLIAAEVLRSCLARRFDPGLWAAADRNQWRNDKAQIEQDIRATLTKLGPGGAQMGAAYNLAIRYYARGPSAVVREVEGERRIMVQKEFPR